MSNTFFSKENRANPYFRFIFLFPCIYIMLHYFNIFYMGITAPGNYYSLFLDEHLNYISGLRSTLLAASEVFLKWMGYKVYTSEYTLHAYNVGGINVVYSCLGFGVMSFFTAFVIAWPGKTIKNKLVFLLCGLLGIQLLNLARFILITLYWRSVDLPFQIDHHNLFNGLLYTILIAALYTWTNYNSQKDLPGQRFTDRPSHLT